MAAADRLASRLLSHRLRGFDTAESTRRGLEKALAAGVRHVEFDVRFTRDDHPIAFHDPFFKADDGTWQYVDAWELAALRGQKVTSELATLEQMCDGFATFARPDTLLHVDVKVAGREEAIHATIAKFGLLPQTVVVSWLPSVLVRFNAMSPCTRLCFSHLSMGRAPWLYRPAKWLYSVAKHVAIPALRGAVARGLVGTAPRLLQEALATSLYFHDSGDPASELDESEDEPRYSHGHVVPGLLSGTTLDLLRETAGIVCLPIVLATRSLGQEYQARGVQLAVYSVKDVPSLQQVLDDVNPDIVYVDNADVVRWAAGLETIEAMAAQHA